jgi:hypothetical protein
MHSVTEDKLEDSDQKYMDDEFEDRISHQPGAMLVGVFNMNVRQR